MSNKKHVFKNRLLIIGDYPKKEAASSVKVSGEGGGSFRLLYPSKVIKMKPKEGTYPEDITLKRKLSYSSNLLFLTCNSQ